MAMGKTSAFIQAVQNDQISFWKTAAGNVESRSWEGLSCWVGPVSSWCFFSPGLSYTLAWIHRPTAAHPGKPKGWDSGRGGWCRIDRPSILGTQNAHRFYTKKWKLLVQHGAFSAFHSLPSNRGSFGWQWRCRLMRPPGISCIAARLSSFPWRSQW